MKISQLEEGDSDLGHHHGFRVQPLNFGEFMYTSMFWLTSKKEISATFQAGEY